MADSGCPQEAQTQFTSITFSETIIKLAAKVTLAHLATSKLGLFVILDFKVLVTLKCHKNGLDESFNNMCGRRCFCSCSRVIIWAIFVLF